MGPARGSSDVVSGWSVAGWDSNGVGEGCCGVGLGWCGV